jgi:hypothetical protein
MSDAGGHNVDMHGDFASLDCRRVACERSHQTQQKFWRLDCGLWSDQRRVLLSIRRGCERLFRSAFHLASRSLKIAQQSKWLAPCGISGHDVYRLIMLMRSSAGMEEVSSKKFGRSFLQHE